LGFVIGRLSNLPHRASVVARGRRRRKKTAGVAGGLLKVSSAYLRAIASPATWRGENQKYAKKKRETFIEIQM
jgi:hypothetical protein